MAEKSTASDQRKTEGLIRDLIDLVPPTRELPKLAREEPRGGIPQRRGYSEVNQQPGTGSTAAGIASPLIEGLAPADPQQPGAPALAREYYPEAVVLSSDGLFVWEYKPIKKISMRDANGAPVVFELANPEEAAP